jgi:hypothetical protein
MPIHTMKTTHYKQGRDTNGNSILRITPHTGRGFSIQTLGNLPKTHRDGVTADTAAEVAEHISAYGTTRQRAALGLPPQYVHGFYNTENFPFLVAHNGPWDIYRNARDECAAIPVNPAAGYAASHFGNMDYVRAMAKEEKTFRLATV